MTTVKAEKIDPTIGLSQPNRTTSFQTNLMASPDVMRERYEGYFGVRDGGINLHRVLQNLDLGVLEGLKTELTIAKATGAKVFIIGNGGSYDNAYNIAAVFSSGRPGLQFNAKTPGNPAEYLCPVNSDGAKKWDYSEIFTAGLKGDGFKAGDILIGLSGSGNSPNVVKAFEYAKQVGATSFSFGGRDGGKAKLVVGNENSLIATSDNMEAIEDVHLIAALIVAEALAREIPLKAMYERFMQAFSEVFIDSSLAANNMAVLGEFGSAVIETVGNEKYLFIAGPDIGSQHFRADAGRGFTNNLPIRGVAAPEFFTINSGMATANDDGGAFIVADGLVKFNPGPNDVALVVSLPGTEPVAKVTDSVLQESGARIFYIGKDPQPGTIAYGPLLEVLDPRYFVAQVGHSCGVSIRDHFWKVFGVRRLEEADKRFDYSGHRKPVSLANDVLPIEAQLRSEGLLNDEEVVTFAYGAVFAARDPKALGMRRVHY